MKRIFKRVLPVLCAVMLAISAAAQTPCAVGGADLPTSYELAGQCYSEADYVIDGDVVYLIIPFVLQSGQSWSYTQRSSAGTTLIGYDIYTKSGSMYVGDEAYIVFRFGASKAGIFRINIFMTISGTATGEANCFNFIVNGDEENGFSFSERFMQSDLMPVTYSEAEQIAYRGGMTVDGDLLIVVVAEDGETTNNATISSSCQWESVVNYAIPIQSESENGFSESQLYYRVFVIRVTSAGDGIFRLTPSTDPTVNRDFAFKSESIGGQIIVSDSRVIKGDLDGDCAVSVVDLAVMKKICMGLYQPDEAKAARADFDGSGALDINDYTSAKGFVCAKSAAASN